MVWLTWNPASAQHAASADQSNARLKPEHLLPTKFSSTVATLYVQRYNRIIWHQSWTDKAAAGGFPPPVQAPTSSLCLRCPADGNRWNAHRSLKQVSQPEGTDQSSRRPWSLKSKFPLGLELKPKVLVEDRSKRGSPKRKSKPKVRV